MDTAYVVSGSRDGKDVCAVFFTNGLFIYSLLKEFEIKNANVERVKPLTSMPSIPTIYVFQGNNIEIAKLNWENEIVSKEKIFGDPSELIPGVSGKAAETFLYKPIAYLIKGSFNHGKTNGLGVLLIKPKAGQKMPNVNQKLFSSLGFSHITSVDNVSCTDNVVGNLFFLVERNPSANEVIVKSLDQKGSILEERTVLGNPADILPKINLPITFIATTPPPRYQRAVPNLAKTHSPFEDDKTLRPPKIAKPKPIPKRQRYF